MSTKARCRRIIDSSSDEDEVDATEITEENVSEITNNVDEADADLDRLEEESPTARSEDGSCPEEEEEEEAPSKEEGSPLKGDESSQSDENEETPILSSKKVSTKEYRSREPVYKKQTDSKKLVKLKRYLSLCGIKVRSYDKMFQECGSMKSKERQLVKLLHDNGIEGNPSIEKCKGLKRKRDQENEIAELDLGNILPSPRTKGRKTRSSYGQQTNKQVLAAQSEDQDSWQCNLEDLIESEDNASFAAPEQEA